MRAVLLTLLLGCGGGASNGAAVCGDGEVVPGIEECDDGGLEPGDGCSAQCRDEGCGDGIVDPDEECDDRNDIDTDRCSNLCTVNGAEKSMLAVSWTFVNLLDGAPTGCPMGFDTVLVESQPIAPGGPTMQPIRDLFDCDPGAVSVTLPPDTYRVRLEVTTTAQDVKYADSLPQNVDLRAQDGAFATTILNDGGYFAAAWRLVDTNNTQLTCAQVANLDHIEIHASNGNTVFTDLFNCEDLRGITGGLLEGDYLVTVLAADVNGASLGDPPAQPHAITAPNVVTDLMVVDVPIRSQ